jgi:hypothetical protein
LFTLLGKILRIDVSGSTPDTAYLIPASNPFVGNREGYREEIWAYGLRNPWRFSFDRATGQLWAADVGQGEREEVDIIEKGKNYGWNIMEGFSCYSPATGCDKTGLTLPLVDYTHSIGNSITGGYVYRGSRRPELIGTYIYGDYGTRKIWSLRVQGRPVPSDTLLLEAPLPITSFGEDQAGELYVVVRSPSSPTHIYRFNKSSVQTGVEARSDKPEEFILEQNFPNPFNPSTTIAFRIPALKQGSGGRGAESGWVKLTVFDILGREVAVLVNERMEPGEHRVSFDGRGLGSGVYYYRLDAGGIVSTKPMVFAK